MLASSWLGDHQGRPPAPLHRVHMLVPRVSGRLAGENVQTYLPKQTVALLHCRLL